MTPVRFCGRAIGLAPLFGPRFGALAVLASALAGSPHAHAAGDPRVDANGVRLLAPVPPPGTHPRIFFGVDDLPDVKSRLIESEFGRRAMWPLVQREVAGFRPALEALASLDLRQPSPGQVGVLFRADERRNVLWGLAALDAFVRGDAAQKALVAKVLTNYAQLILAAQQLAASGAAGSPSLAVWRSDVFDSSVFATMGGLGLALGYDLLHDDMTPEQRTVIRRALAAATTNRRSYAMDAPRGRAMSSAAGAAGDLAVMLAAIEGEEGYDAATYRRVEQVLADYLDVGFGVDGASHEDGRGIGVGLRSGSRGLLVLARRGKDLLRSDRYRNIVRYYAMELEPSMNGRFVGGGTQGDGWLDPTAAIIARYIRPKDPVTSFVWRSVAGDDYRRTLPTAAWLDLALFATDWAGDANAPAILDATDMPLMSFYARRGKFIARSDWSPAALALHLDARPDAFAIDSDTVDRGTFALFGLGREWAIHAEGRLARASGDFNLVHIDGLAQAWKAPSVRFVRHQDASVIATAVADLKYAYDWQWSPSWPGKQDALAAPWEPENSDPRALGWPDDPVWLPRKLFDEPGLGPAGSYLWRRPYNAVQKAFRAAMLVRCAQPYVLIVDDVRKNDQVHAYSWHMQLPADLELDSNEGRDVVLRDSRDERRLLVRVLEADGYVGTQIESYQAPLAADPKQSLPGRRLIVLANSIEPRFKVLLFPHKVGDPMPRTRWSGQRKLSVEWDGQRDAFEFVIAIDGRTHTAFSRNGTPLARD